MGFWRWERNCEDWWKSLPDCLLVFQVIAENTKAEVQKEEQAASVKQNETEAIAADAQKDLDEALPALASFYITT